MEVQICLLVLISAIAFQSSNAVTIGFTEADYGAEEKNGQVTLILTVSDTPVNLNISLTILSFEQFFNDSTNKLPDAFTLDDRDPAEYSLDSSGRRDFINRGTIYVYFNASNTRQSQEVEIPIVNDEYNEASESFLVLIDQSIIIPEEILVFLRDGIALVTIADDDPIQLEFDETVYTINEADSMADDVITVTKGGVVSEQVLDGVVQVVALTPYSAELGTDFELNRTYFFTLYPENNSLPVPVTVNDDMKVENLERFGLVLSVANNLASVGTNHSATVFIVDSTDVVIGFENMSYSIIEGNTSEVCVTVKEPQNMTLDFPVFTSITTLDGSAIGNKDYIRFTELTSANSRVCFDVMTIDNNVTEPNKNFSISLTFVPFGISRTFDTDTPFITIEIVDNDDPCGNNDCHINADCLSTPGIQGYQCVCKPGFIGDGRTCVDPCLSGMNDCDVNAECTTVLSAPGYQCTCKLGYLGNGRTCVAICSQGSHDCHSDAFCTPHPDGRNYNCQCRMGFAGNGKECENFCDANLHHCNASADCIPAPGGYTCKCKRGFIGDGFNCDAVCSPGTHDCHSRAYCIPSFDGQGHFCQCGIGMVGDGRQCDDYCKAGLHRCHSNADCTPTFGGYQCKCREGYTGDGFTCADADECLSGNKCHVNADCLNTEGGYTCTCKEGFVGNGLECFPQPTTQEPIRDPSPPTSEPSPPTSEPSPPTSEPSPPTSEPSPPTSEPSPPITELSPPITELSPPCDQQRSATSSRRTRSRTTRSRHTTHRRSRRSHRRTGTDSDDGIAASDNGCGQRDTSESSQSSSHSHSHTSRSHSHKSRSHSHTSRSHSHTSRSTSSSSHSTSS